MTPNTAALRASATDALESAYSVAVSLHPATVIPPDWHTYLVGTAQTGGDYRDVDVRTILRDDEFDAVFGARPDLWEAWCFTTCAWLKAATGLPVDYQVQRMTEANEKHHGGGRNPLGSVARTRIHGRQYAGRGDATRFTPTDNPTTED